MPPTPEPAPSLSDEDWSALKDAVRRFEDSWRRGPHPSIDSYLPSGDSLRTRVLIELVHIDLELRLKAGAAALGLIVAEHELRRRQDGGLSLEDYLRRFPQYGAELTEQLVRPIVDARDVPRFPPHPGVEALPEVAGYEVLERLGRGGMGV